MTAKKMHLLGIHNGLQLHKCSLEMLTGHFGKAGTLYMNVREELTNVLSKQFVSVNPSAVNVHWNGIFRPVHRYNRIISRRSRTD